MRALVAANKVKLLIGQMLALHTEAGRLAAISVKTKDGEIRVPANRLMPFFGLTMKLGPVANWGLNLNENPFALTRGEIRNQRARHLRRWRHQLLPGQTQADPVGFPRGGPDGAGGYKTRLSGQEAAFQYTTSSSSLQRKLGVS